MARILGQIKIAVLAIFFTAIVNAGLTTGQTTEAEPRENINTDVDVDAYLEKFFPNHTRKQDYMRSFLKRTNFSDSIDAQDDEAFVPVFFEEKLSLYLEPALIAFNKEVRDDLLNTHKTDSLWATIGFIIVAIGMVTAFGIGWYCCRKQTHRDRTWNVWWKMAPKPDQSAPESP